MKTIHLGFEVGTGEPVAVPLRHTAITGQTQESGKTTTLEALAARAGIPAIAFVTKRGERAFAGGRRLQPYFRDRADWQFVDQLISAQLGEKNKFLRPWIIRICRTTKTLADVHREVRRALEKAKGINEGVYTQLDAYLDLIVPEIGRARLADAVSLEPGLNVMDVSGYRTPMQMLFVQSAIDWVLAKEHGVVTIVPEAWEFIPQAKGSPAKASAEALVRKGAGLGNYLFVDSQDMAAVDKAILRGCAVWLIGVQREANEIKRNLSNIPAGIRRPSAADVAGLGLGEFYACWGSRTVRTYVQPAWMAEDEARAVAQGKIEVAATRSRPVPLRSAASDSTFTLENFVTRGTAAQSAVDKIIAGNSKEDPAMCERHQVLERDLAALRGKVEVLRREYDTQGKAKDAEIAAVRRELIHTNSLLKAAAPDAQAGRDLAAALMRLLPKADGTVKMSGAAFDEDALVRRVLASIPAGAGGPVTITPPEKLRKDFQVEEAARILAAAKELDPLQKRILRLLESTEDGVCVSQKAVAERLGRSTGGGSWVTTGSAIKGLAGIGFIEVRERQGASKRLRRKISEDLAFYQATEAEAEAVYQNVLHEVAVGADA